MSNQVTLTISAGDRNNQLNARTEIRATCRDYLAKAEAERNPDTAEQILLAMLDYFDGEEKAGV